eukprot:SAG22_NODE_1517_length_4241_cov_6.138098_2_plen_284_part_00
MLLTSVDPPPAGAGPYFINGAGEGLPDSFSHRPLQDPALPDGAALGVGVGLKDAAELNTVLEPCSWTVAELPVLPGAAGGPALKFTTEQQHGSFRLALERTVSLIGRTVRVETVLRNRGGLRIPIVWHPHPFYPWPHTPALMKANMALSVRDGAPTGFGVDDAGYICRKFVWTESDDPCAMGYLQHADERLMLVQNHPVVGMVAARTSYVPTFFPIWGNSRTFSWEPYFERTVTMGDEEHWSIDYEFGDIGSGPAGGGGGGCGGHVGPGGGGGGGGGGGSSRL